MNHQNPTSHRSGFALVATIAVLILLTLVGLAYLSLTAVKVKTSRSDWEMEEARANARLGLMIALGELQREMGPDRRVSASAEILDANPETPEIEGVRHRHWLAYFDTNYSDARNGSPWSRDDLDGGLRDERGGLNYRAKDHVRGYFVSGDEGGRERSKRKYLDALDADLGDEDDQVSLVGQGSVNDPADEVSVARVEMPGDGVYGWWVTSLGARAAVSVADRHRDERIDPEGNGVQRLTNAMDVELAVVEGMADAVEDDVRKLITANTLELVHPSNREGLRDNYHALTGNSRGVLVNVRDGGLKRDLTAYLYSDGSVDDLNSTEAHYLGLKDRDRLTGPMNDRMGELRGFDLEEGRYKEIAPTFQILREWHGFSQTNSFTRDSMNQLPPEVWPTPPNCYNPNGFWDVTNFNSVQFAPVSQPNITPLLTEASVYYNLVSFPFAEGKYAMRMCLYPRVSLWNPYSVALRTPPMICQLFVNGGKQVEVTVGDSTKFREAYFGGYRDDARDTQYGGMIFMRVPEMEIPAGKTLVFSPASTRRLSITDYSSNALATDVNPSTSRYFYQDYTKKNELFDQPPTRFRENPKNDNKSGADNYMVALKQINTTEPINRSKFRTLPLFSVVAHSLQAGGSDELPLQWNSMTAEVHELNGPNDVLGANLTPDVRTRDGFRLRWWKETDSNIQGSGALSQYPGHLQSAALGNWNLRAAFTTRTPFDNVSPVPPYFHGIYTRDQPDSEVEWDDLNPVQEGDFNRGFPFSAPNEGEPALIAFELPSRDVGIPSIAYLRHLKISEFVWHPSYAIGNSLVDPRVPRTRTSPVLPPGESSLGGWNNKTLGSTYWAELFRDVMHNQVENSNLVYDQSYEVNFNLWDDYFVSTGSPARKERFAQDPGENPLPNGRFGVFAGSSDLAEDLQNFHRAAFRLSVEGAFDVHSTNKEAWKAILSSTRDIGFGSKGVTPYPRMLKVGGGDYLGEQINDATYSGFRSLRNEEIDALAEALVYEVKRRAPFFGLADFVNRRLADDDTGRSGVIESAISRAGINAQLIEKYPIDRSRELPDLTIAQPSTDMTDCTRLRVMDKAESTAWGLPGYLTQGDVLQIIGSTLSARSDTFLIRAYGESKDANGKVLARAWCEATVQRIPDPVRPDSEGLNPAPVEGSEVDFGRRFQIVSFRWLNEDEV